jgi:hypothetical protein
MSLHREPVVIVGMQRSGTSALAGALSKLGLSFGKSEMLYAADANNREGYFEHRKATILNLGCLDAFQMHPTSFGRLPENWLDHPLAASFVNQLTEFIEGDFANRGRWGIKQPVTSLVMPLYNHVFDRLDTRPHYVLCVRNPLETMRSEARLDFGDSYRVMPSLGERAIGSWLRYTLGAFADAAGRPLTVAPYDAMLSDPRRILEKIVAKHSDWTPTAPSWAGAIGSIKGDLRHNRAAVEGLENYPSIVAETLKAAQSFDEDKWAHILELHREFLAWVEMFAEPAPPAGKLGLAWTDPRGQRVSETGYIPTRDWQSVRLAVDAPPKTNLAGLFYGWPGRIWIRRCVWRDGETVIPARIQTGPASRIWLTGSIHCLETAFEPNQINLATPGAGGPFELEIEFWLEYGEPVSRQAATRLAQSLEASVSAVERLTS